MLNHKEKKLALERMNEKNDELQTKQDRIISESGELFSKREILKQRIDQLWQLINEFRNKPEQLNTNLKQVKIEYTRFADLVKEVQVSSEQLDVKAGSVVGGGIVAGAGVAALAPTAAMGIATTFGTAATGTAISSLSGAAATNAALAWLGGGALAAGGGGMTAGSALLALSGPVGWTIAGAGVAVGGVLANGKNKKVIQQANEATQKLISQINIHEGNLLEIERLTIQTTSASKNVEKFGNEIGPYDRNYNNLDDSEQYRLGSIVNNIYSYAKLLNKSVGAAS